MRESGRSVTRSSANVLFAVISAAAVVTAATAWLLRGIPAGLLGIALLIEAVAVLLFVLAAMLSARAAELRQSECIASRSARERAAHRALAPSFHFRKSQRVRAAAIVVLLGALATLVCPLVLVVVVARAI